MAKRPSVTDFKPSNSERLADAAYLERAVTELGGALLDPLPQNRADRDSTLAQALMVAERLRSTLALGPEDTSVALVDWSALMRACALLEGDRGNDPFVALADLATLISACLFYDRVLVIDGGDLVRKAERSFGLPGVFVNLDLDVVGDSLRRMLAHHYSWAWHHFNSSTEEGSDWIQWLADAWKAVLPDLPFPEHTARAYDRKLGYNTSPNRQSWIDVVFKEGSSAWKLDPADKANLILDNDIRALVYERVAQSFDVMASSGDAPARVRYLGGCLRAPLLLARAKYASSCLAGRPAVENWLHAEWAKHHVSIHEAVQLPFWIGAVVSRCNGRRAAFAAEMARFRARLAQMRRRKSSLEEALLNYRTGDALVADARRAVLGEVQELVRWIGTAASAGGIVAGATMAVASPGTPAEVVKGAQDAATLMGGIPWLQKLALRLFRPHLYFVLDLASNAQVLNDSIRAAAVLFELGGKAAAAPVSFLQRVARIQWLI